MAFCAQESEFKSTSSKPEILSSCDARRIHVRLRLRVCQEEVKGRLTRYDRSISARLENQLMTYGQINL
ncbi:MAG UNVERIFIED_CONTAM: hypothetical protein LVR29_30985 [Microcystis novacekii LVE1205-3]